MIAEATYVDTLLRRAALLGEVGRWREAIPLLQNALLTEPDNARLHCRMAEAQLQVGNFVLALNSAERAISLNPTCEWAYHLRCSILMKGKNARRILRTAEEAFALNPNSRNSLSLMVQALLRSSQSIRAREMAERLRQVAPNSSQTHEAFVLVALKQHQWVAAEIHCREMLKIDPLSSVAFNNLGLALRFSNRGAEAVQCLWEAHKLNPANSSAFRTLRSAINDYLFGSEFVFYLLAGAVLCIFFGYLPLGDRATYGPVWLHVALFMLAPVLVTVVVLFIRGRLRKLPPSVRHYILPKKKRRNDI